MISTAIQQLVNYGLDTGLILPDDEIYIRNQLLMTMQLDSFAEPEGDICYTDLESILKTLVDDAVARGVCEEDENGFLRQITERTRIEPKGDAIAYTEDEGKTWVELPGDSLVSMNLWGFTRSFVTAAQQGFADFLRQNLPVNPLKCEYYLPSVVSAALADGRAEVKVLTSTDKWYGITYREDKPALMAALQAMTDAGTYPQGLWK